MRSGIDTEVSVGRHWLGKIQAIAGNTATEAIRQPVFAIILCVAVGLIILSPFLTMFTLMEGPKMVKDMGLATMFLGGLLLAAFATANVVSEEIENHTALTVMSKPMGRFEFVLGKYLGVLAAVTVAFYLMGVALVLVVMLGGVEAGAMQTTNYPVLIAILAALSIALGAGVFANYFYDASFASVAMKTALLTFSLALLIFSFVNPESLEPIPFLAAVDIRVVYSVLLLYLAMFILSSVALAASTRMNVVVNVSFCAIVFYLGLLSDFLFGSHKGTSLFARIAYGVTPNLQVFWTADILAVDGSGVPLSYVTQVAGYAISYSLAVLFVAMILFEERQLS